MGDEAGHVFISYVREDSARVDDLQRMLESAGVRVWRDTVSLWPGEDWKTRIRRAIADDALVFLACFSANSVRRRTSYQNEELTLAVDELRRRRVDEPWLIPVRLDDCDVPDIEIGGGRTLRSIQQVDVFGVNAAAGVRALLAATLRILGRREASEPRRSWGQVQPDGPAASFGKVQPTFAIITALPEEFAAMQLMIDNQERRDRMTDDRADYIVGTIPSLDRTAPHRVVLTLLAETGNDAASSAVTNIVRSFRSVQCVLMVGIAAGVPRPDHPDRHVRLGDIVVATWGIFEYDSVTDTVSGPRPRRQFPPPSPLLVRRSNLLAAAEQLGKQSWTPLLNDTAGRFPAFRRPPASTDVLYADDSSTAVIPQPDDTMTGRLPGLPKVHRGLIASGDRSLRSVRKRDELARNPDVLAVEMEGKGLGNAGFLEGVEWFVVRGISDYGDGRANQQWRGYAALAAAAYTWALLGECPAIAAGPAADPMSVAPTEASAAEFREDLAALIAAIEKRAVLEQLPPYVPPGANVMDLTRPIRVSERPRFGPGDDEAARRLPGPRPDQEPDGRRVADWPVVAEREDRIVILANPGMGKSWLIRWETVRLARVAIAQLAAGDSLDDVIVPVPIRCDELVSSPRMTVDAVTSYLCEHYVVPARSRGQLRGLISGRRAVLLLDALDEIADTEARRRLDDLLSDWVSDPRAPFRLTSRVAGYTSIPVPASTVSVVELQPFTQADVSSAILSYGLSADATTRLRHMSDHPAMANIMRIPLLTALLCATAGEGDELPRYTAGIYERMLRRSLAQENRWPRSPGPQPAEIDRIIEVLAPLAFHFAVRPDGWADRMPANQIMAALRATGPVFVELGGDAAAIIRDLSVRAGVLVPSAGQHAGRNPPYLFMHRSIAEYLVAWHLASLPRENWLETVYEHLWLDPDWLVTIGLLGAAFVQQERPAEAVFLLRHLLEQRQDPFNAALFAAIRVLSELPDHDVVPRDLQDRAARQMIGLLDRQADGAAAARSLSARLTRLPWGVTELLLRSLDGELRGIAAKILANSRDDRVTSRLIRMLDEDGEAREAFDALSEQDADCYARALVERFDNPHQRSRAAQALVSKSSPEVTLRMLERAGNVNPKVRFYALHVLCDREDATADEVVCALTADPDRDVRLHAVAALSVRTDEAATAALRARLDDPEPVVRFAVLSALIDADRLMLTDILGYARHPDPEVRLRAANALAAFPSEPQATLALLDLVSAADYGVRRSAAEALASHQGDAVVAALLRLLDDEACAAVACWSLRGRDRPDVTERVLQWTAADRTDKTLIAACSALAKTTSSAARDFLLHHARAGSELVREAAVRALGQQAGTVVTAALVEALGDSSHFVRQAAAKALRPLVGEPPVADALLKRLSDPSDEVRGACVRALELADRSPAVLSAMIRRLSDESDQVRQAAARTLQNSPTSAPLLAISRLRKLPADSGLIALYEATESLGDRLYRSIPPKDRPAVLSGLARLTDRAVTVRVPAKSAQADSFRPDTGYLDTEVVTLVTGTNLYGDRVFSYLKLTGRQLQQMFEAMEIGMSFKPADYGEVIASGQGSPSPDLVKRMKDEYDMIEVPAPERPYEPEPSPPPKLRKARLSSRFLVDSGSEGE